MEIREELKEIIEPILKENGFELIELIYRREGRNPTLRILADKKGGITVGECSFLNQMIGDALDKRDLIQEPYILEVNSPGLDRPLKTENDFGRVLGKKIRVNTRRSLEGIVKGNTVTGILKEVDANSIKLEIDSGEVLEIPLENIARGVLEIEI